MIGVLKNGKRLCFVFLSVFAEEGGIQSYVKDILKAYSSQSQLPSADVLLLRDLPAHSSLLTESKKLTFQYLGRYGTRHGRLMLGQLLLLNLLKNRYAHVICGHVLLTPLVYPLCAFFQVSLTVMTYGKEVWEPLPMLQRQALQRASQIWAISRYSRDLAISNNHLNPSKFRMLPCAVEGNLFTPGEANPRLVKKYGLHNQRVLLTVARLWSGDIYKGVDVTLRSLPQILQIFPETKYLIVGQGDDQPRLARLAMALGIAKQVEFAGFVPTDELVEHYRLADAYVMPSREGFGIVYLEAMACGVPVLSGDEDGSAEPLQDGRLGWRVPYRNPEAVATACVEMLKGEDIRCDSTWLRQQTLENFSFSVLQTRLVELLTPSPSFLDDL